MFLGGETRRDEWAKAHFSFERNAVGEAAMMTFNLEQIRQAASRVAASHQLEIVEIDYLGGSKHRILRIFIEKNREERVRCAAEAEALREGEGKSEVPAHAPAGNALDRLAWDEIRPAQRENLRSPGLA